MKTLSIIQIKEELRQTVTHFSGIECYKVEVSLWDFDSLPKLKLYVCCQFHGERYSVHTRSQSLPKALQEIKDWYAATAPPVLVAEIDTTEPAFDIPW